MTEAVAAVAENLIGIATALFILAGIFFVLREFWAWYWKINEIRDLLKELVIATRARHSAESQASRVATKPTAPELLPSDSARPWTCEKCGNQNRADAFQCRQCGSSLA